MQFGPIGTSVQHFVPTLKYKAETNQKNATPLPHQLLERLRAEPYKIQHQISL